MHMIVDTSTLRPAVRSSSSEIIATMFRSFDDRQGRYKILTIEDAKQEQHRCCPDQDPRSH